VKEKGSRACRRAGRRKKGKREGGRPLVPLFGEGGKEDLQVCFLILEKKRKKEFIFVDFGVGKESL